MPGFLGSHLRDELAAMPTVDDQPLLLETRQRFAKRRLTDFQF